MAAPLKPLPPKSFGFAEARHLLNRAGFGGTPAQVEAVRAMGLDAAVDYIVDYDDRPEPTEATPFDADIMGPPTPDEQAFARRARAANDENALAQIQRMRQERERRDRLQLAEMRKWWLKRMIETGRPLEEKMTLFWHGHVATGYRTIEDSWHCLAQNNLFRRMATGNVAELVGAIIRDPAMIKYLDNDENRRGRPNENLARELMELFTLGEGNGYTEDDIKEAARALTGYTFRDDEFRFDDGQHDPRPKAILGVRGRFDGDDLVRILMRRREASEFLCLKLHRFLVNDAPGEPDAATREAVVGMASELREARYELKPVLKALFRSAWFHGPANQGAVIKSPIQLAVQAIRSFRTPTRELSALASAADLMGQNLFQPPNVKGWDGGRSWINTSTLFVRQNLLVYLITGRRPNTYDWELSNARFDAGHLIDEPLRAAGELPPDPRELAEWLLRVSLAVPPSPERIAAVADVLGPGRPSNDRLLGALCLITALPEYQLC
jgi:uncharacterized protein (DUF1800 family)